MGETNDSEVYRVGDVVLDVGAGLVTRNGEVVPLPPKTFELFATLVRRAPGVVKRQELLDSVWPDEIVNDEALTQRLMLLRRALGDDPKAPTFIASVPRWGYRLVAPVERQSSASAAPVAPGRDGTAEPPDDPSADSLRPAAPPAAAGAAAPAKAAPAVRTVRRVGYRPRSLRWLLVVLAVAAAIVALYLARTHRRPATSLAVLPFATGGADIDTEALADGVRENLTSTLARLPGVRVTAASAMSRYKGKEADPQTAGRELGVRTVVAGRMVRRGDTLSVSAELVSVADGSQLWGGSSIRPISDIFLLQEELASEIALRLGPRLAGAAGAALRHRYTEDVAAYQLYVKGRYHWNKRTVQGFDDAIACFKQAIAEDPSYALAYAGLADCYALLGAAEYGALPPRDVMPKARAAAERALEIDASLAEAHASLGLVQFIFDWDRAAAEGSLRRAIAINPSYASAHQWYGEMLAELGRLRDGEAEIRRALELDPLSLVINADLGLLSYYARDYEKAVVYYRATLAMEPYFVPARLGLALVYSQQDRPAEALAELAEAGRIAPGEPAVLATLGYALARAGRADEARTLAEKLRGIAAERYVPAYYLAGVPIGLGDVDAAFAALDRACEERSSLLGSLAVDPLFDPLRKDPRFAATLRCVGLAR